MVLQVHACQNPSVSFQTFTDGHETKVKNSESCTLADILKYSTTSNTVKFKEENGMEVGSWKLGEKPRPQSW